MSWEKLSDSKTSCGRHYAHEQYFARGPHFVQSQKLRFDEAQTQQFNDCQSNHKGPKRHFDRYDFVENVRKRSHKAEQRKRN